MLKSGKCLKLCHNYLQSILIRKIRNNMNYLAHLYLSDSDNCLIGNFLGDFVKGLADNIPYSGEIKKGIILHREIDAFTDSHPLTQVSRNRIQDEHSIYSGILIDVFYDHFLAVNFDKFSETPLEEFAQSAYDVIKRNFQILPPKIKSYAQRMFDKNWLVNYKRINIIERVLVKISSQLSHKNPLDKCIFYLTENYSDLEQDFLTFFPKLIDFAKSFNENYSN